MYAEDLDLGRRLSDAGRPTRYEPQARVRHAGGAAASQAFSDAEVRKQRETYAWLRSRRGRAVTAAIAAVNVAGAAIRWLPRAVLARARPERWAWERDRWRAHLRRHLDGFR
jgi:GT2 family glycosyltransferase